MWREELGERFSSECDYALEAQSQADFAERFRGAEDIHVPAVVPQWSTKRVLTSEFVEGRTLEAFAASASQEERDRAGDALWRFYYESVLLHGTYNTDPNPGNLLFHPGGKVTFLDFGRVKRLTPAYREQWRRIGRAVLERDTGALRATLVETGYVPRPERFDFEPMFRFLRLWTRPCLTEGRFRFTPGLLKKQWSAWVEDPTRGEVSFTRDMVFLNQLCFGVSNVLAHLSARVRCRELFLPLLYRPGEATPPPYSREELLPLDDERAPC